MLDMRTESIRTVQHELASLINEVEQGREIVITRHRRPVARLVPVNPMSTRRPTAPALRAYWKARPKPPAVRGNTTHAELIAEGRGDV
jgi:prevent-host-death family protein